MFNRPDFEQHDEGRLFECIEQHSFATLISPGQVHPEISHLPLLLDRTERKLVGHMARANSQWESASDQPVVVVFHGPNTYISPTWYAEANVVPTWNYVVVHVHGVLRLLEDDVTRVEVLQKYVATYEAAQPRPWSVDDVDADFVLKLARQTVAFEIPITRLEGKWKLNQNHSAQRRRRVVAALRQTGSPDGTAIADLMQASLDGTDP